MTRHSATLVADRRIEGVELAGDPDRRPIVLLHEGQPLTIEALPRVVGSLKESGHELVTVGELLD